MHQVGHLPKCCINTNRPPDDEHNVARNMHRIIIINILYNVIVHQVGHLPKCCINTNRPPDDEHSVARNMQRITIINILYNVIVHQVGHLPGVVPGCTVSKTKCLFLITTATDYKMALKAATLATLATQFKVLK